LKNVVILLNGEFPNHDFTISILNKSDYIICCDGAVNQLEDFGLNPSIIIGDMDSINDSLKNKYANKLIQIKEQTDTDLEKALNYCVNNKINEVNILGFSGKRDDQYLSNIFLGFEYSHKLNIEMYSNFGSFFFVNKKQIFESFKGQTVSIFSISKETTIKTNNLKYFLNEDSLPFLYSGISNESISNWFSLKVAGGSIMVYILHRN